MSHAEGITERQEQAAQLIAAGKHTDKAIALQLGLNRKTLQRWRDLPDFTARIEALSDTIRQGIVASGIVQRQNRIDAQNERWRKMQQVIDERAADELSGTLEVATGDDGERKRITAPGWKTGLLVRTEKIIGTGPAAQRVVEFAVDTGLLKELRAHEEQAAKELGQWTDKKDVTSAGEPITFTIEIDRRTESDR